MAKSRWLIVELSEQGESASYDQLEKTLEHILGPGVDFFIPVHKEVMGSYTSMSVLFENYIFVKDCEDSRRRFDEIKECRYFHRILNTNGKVSTIDAQVVGSLKRKLLGLSKREYDVGTNVKIIDGIFQNMTGEILGIEDNGRKAVVRVKTYSREIIAPMPATNLVEVGQNEPDYY